MKPQSQHNMLPEYPSTLHLPWKTNAKSHIATPQDAAILFQSPFVSIQEKIDGASCGMTMDLDGFPVIRNRSKIIRKGKLTGDANPSISQFAGVYNWFYKNTEKFEKLTNQLGHVSVYGEWMVQQHGMVYDNLPDWFVAYDVYDWESEKYFDPQVAMTALINAGFSVVPVLHYGKINNKEQLIDFTNSHQTPFSSSKGEGIYVKVSDGKWVTDRFKMVREGFEQGCLLGNSRRHEIKKNKVV